MALKGDHMQSRNQPGVYFDTVDAVSNLIASLLLVAIVTLGIGMIAVSFLSNPEPLEIPVLNVDLKEREGNIILLHDGGDTLYRQTTRILVDGVDRTDEFKTPEGDDWSTFSVGDQLVSTLPRADGKTIQIVYASSENPTVILSLLGQPLLPPVAFFSTDPSSGYVPLTISFTDLSTGYPNSWMWNFSTISFSIDRNPTYTYNSSGQYAVTLTACNGGGCSSYTRNVTVFGFSDYVVNESVFVYGSQMYYSGDDVEGTGSTIIITGDLSTLDLNGGASIAVTDIYIDGNVYLDGGSAGLGSSAEPGIIVVNGSMTLWKGSREIYGDVYVNGDFRLKDAIIHGNVYVNGDLELGWTPSLDPDSYIYYTGSFTYPPSMYPEILAKCIHQDTVPTMSMPAMEIPEAKSADWYSSRGYVSGGLLLDNAKIYSGSYTSFPDYDYGVEYQGENVIIVAYDGDITLGDEDNYWSVPVTGVLFAPNGKVTFSGKSFEGVVIAKKGFYVESGGTSVVFRNVEEYISDPADYPF